MSSQDRPNLQIDMGRKRSAPEYWKYFLGGGPDWETKFLSCRSNRAIFKRFQRAARTWHPKRLAAKAKGHTTPPRARDLRSAMRGFLRGEQFRLPGREAGRPTTTNDTFASQFRKDNLWLGQHDAKTQTRAINRARNRKAKRKRRAYTSFHTSVTAADLNVPLLRKWWDLGLEKKTPDITKAVLGRLETDGYLAWRFWRSGGGMGRLWADPWDSLASINCDARAVLCYKV